MQKSKRWGVNGYTKGDKIDMSPISYDADDPDNSDDTNERKKIQERIQELISMEKSEEETYIIMCEEFKNSGYKNNFPQWIHHKMVKKIKASSSKEDSEQGEAR